MKLLLNLKQIYLRCKIDLFTFINKYPVLAVTIYLVLFANVAFWTAFIKINTGDFLDMLSFAISLVVLMSTLVIILFHLVRFKYILKPALIFILVASSFASYFMTHYGIVIDVTMIYNLMETDPNEAGDMLTSGLMFHVFLFGLLPSIIVYKSNINYLPPFKQAYRNTAIIGLCLVILTSNILLFSTSYASFFRNHHHVRYLVNPVNYVYSISKYFAQTISVQDKTPIQIGLDAHRAIPVSNNKKKSVIVLVVGETARAMNFSLNGYAKKTNPLLEKENIFYYPNVHSCGTSTHVSLPCMFSMFGRAEFDEASAIRYEKLPDVLQRAGIDVLWRDNNSGCKGVCKNIPTENTSLVNLDSVCTSSECYDDALLVGLKDIIEAKTKDTVIILHQKGSHGPAYYLRHPVKYTKFTPECMSKELSNCSTEEIMNAYDNTILYTDHFLSDLIALLKSEESNIDTAMLYISDHGESLGEHNVYLHSLPYMIAPEEQTHVPFITWFSTSFVKNNHLDHACLKKSTNDHYSHDNLFHSLLGLTYIETSIYKPELDMFKNCRKASGYTVAKLE